MQGQWQQLEGHACVFIHVLLTLEDTCFGFTLTKFRRERRPLVKADTAFAQLVALPPGISKASLRIHHNSEDIESWGINFVKEHKHVLINTQNNTLYVHEKWFFSTESLLWSHEEISHAYKINEFQEMVHSSQETKHTYTYVACLSKEVNKERRILSQKGKKKGSLRISRPITLISYFNQNIFF